MFRKVMIIATLLPVFLAGSKETDAEELIREFSGTASTITSEFEVTGPWLLDWRVNSDYSQFMAVDIILLDGKTGFQIGKVKHKKEPDNGVRLFESGGRYKLRIDSSHTRWQVKIIEISRSEAELYTPK